MKKSIQTLLLAFSLSGTSLLAQEQQTVMPCATYDAMEAAFQADPSLRAKYEAEQEKIRQATVAYEESLKNQKIGAAFQYTIPVVFHILHENGSENISDANCFSALPNSNNDFAATGPDVATISSLSANLLGDAGQEHHWGQHFGIILIELGVLLTVAATMIVIFYVCTRARR